MGETVLELDSITDADAASAGRIAVSGSHGGLYAAAYASKYALRAVIFNDAGIGLERAGVAGVLALDTVGMAAAAADCQSCRIGSAADAVARGRLSTVNQTAAALGLAVGMPVAEAAAKLDAAPLPAGTLPEVPEARAEIVLATGTRVHLLDSASLVKPEDKGEVVVTGSHGALIGGDATRALKAMARAAVFNDAGVGIDGMGITRLPALDGFGVAAVTVDAMTARIGEARSAYETGVISHANATAAALGARPGLALKSWLETL